MEVIDVLQQATVENGVVKLPAVTLDKKTYQQVAKALEGIGGKWKGGKVAGFVFAHDPTDLLAEIAGGAKRNLKKEFQFFGTPDSLADQLVEMADVWGGLEILEPSAGQGALVKAVRRIDECALVDCFELMPQNRQILAAVPGARIIGEDFLVAEPRPVYDRIIANPPFSANQDVQHIRRMYEFLAPGGRLVSIASKHWQTSGNRTEKQFREWLDAVQADVEPVDAGTFKESGTNVPTCIISIYKG